MELEGYLIMTWWEWPTVDLSWPVSGSLDPGWLGGLAEMELDMPKLMGRPNHPSHQGKGTVWYLLRWVKTLKRTQTIKNQYRQKVARPSLSNYILTFSAISSIICKLGSHLSVSHTCILCKYLSVSHTCILCKYAISVRSRTRSQTRSALKSDFRSNQFELTICMDFSVFYLQTHYNGTHFKNLILRDRQRRQWLDQLILKSQVRNPI